VTEDLTVFGTSTWSFVLSFHHEEHEEREDHAKV